MPEITPEEQAQKVKSRLLEDLEFEPEQVVNFYTRNIFQRALAHLVGWTGRASKILRCTEAGELKTAPTTTGIEHEKTWPGTAGDDWSESKHFNVVVSRVDMFIWDNPAEIRFYCLGLPIGNPIEVPVGFYSIDCRCEYFLIKNKTAGQNVRYQVIGWW